MNTDLLSGLIFLAVFTGVILIHELGHFVAGRLLNVEVEEFGFGIPPKMLTLFHWKGTEFTLNWLPFGGFNRFKGEGDPEVKDGLMDAKPWVRLIIFLAGATMNLLAGVLVVSIILKQVGLPDYSVAQIVEISPDSPAEASGMLPNDIILAINGEAVDHDGEAQTLIRAALDTEATFTIRRGEQTLTLTATPSSARSAEVGALGVVIGPSYQPAASWFEVLPYSLQATAYQAQMILMLPVRLIEGTLAPDEGRFVGIKSIRDMFRKTVDRDIASRRAPPTADSAPQEPTFFTLDMIAMLTITLGVFNLLPLPALDGGRILFVLAEMIFRRRVPPKYENLIHAAGMIALLALMIYINVMDFVNPVNISLP